MPIRKPLFTNSMDAEDKFKKLEKIIMRLVRRERKTQSVMITPYPISNCYTGDLGGPILKYMFSARGTVSRGLVTFNVKPKAGIRISVALENDLGKTERAYNLSTKTVAIEPRLEVFSGDKLIVSADFLNIEKEIEKDAEKPALNEVWCSLLWVPHVKETEIKQMLLDEVYEDTVGD